MQSIIKSCTNNNKINNNNSSVRFLSSLLLRVRTSTPSTTSATTVITSIINTTTRRSRILLHTTVPISTPTTTSTTGTIRPLLLPPTYTPNSNNYIKSFIQWYSLRLETHPYLIKGITSGLIAATGDFTCQYFMSKSSSSLSSVTMSKSDRMIDDKDEHDKDVASTNSISVLTSNVDTNVSTLGERRISSLSSYFSWWDYLRTIRFGILGTLYVAPGCHIWYQQLARTFPISNHSIYIPVIQRVVLDQLLFTPIFLIGWLLSLSKLESIMTTTNTTTTNASSSSSSSKTAMVSDNGATTTTITSILYNCYQLIIVDYQLVSILYSNWILWIPVQFGNFYYIPTKYQVLISNCASFIWNMYLSYRISSSSSTTTTTTTTPKQ